VTTADDLSPLRRAEFAEAVLKLEELMTQCGRAFLIGAGCSKCAGLPLTAELTEKVLGSTTLDAKAKDVLNELKSLFEGTTDANIEDYLSELIDLLAIAERRAIRGAKEKEVDLNGKKVSADQLREAVEQIKCAITEVIDCNINIEIHRDFIRAVHRPLRPGKVNNNQIVDYLILNYDTLLEDTLAIERVPFADGLDGGVTGWWSFPTFRREGLAARVLKLHGSINWCEFQDDPLPRRVAKRLSIKPTDNCRILIWPASTKYRETQRDPYAQLVELAREVLRPKIGSHQVLLVCGYRFSDAHINIEIDNALRESEGRLTVVIFTDADKLMGQIKTWNEDMSISEQVLIFSKRGFFHGTHAEISPVDLPWWKFENLARLLGGER